MGMTEEEKARQRAAYATDISSLESTDESLHNSDSEYDADDILAQRVYDDDDEPVVQYLVKYTDYPLHRCTWEPKAHLRPQLYQSWKHKGRTMGTDKRDEEGHKNMKMFDEAVAKANIAKAKRQEKRKAAREEERARNAARREKESAVKKKGIARKITPSNRPLHTSTSESKSKPSASFRHKKPIASSTDDEADDQVNPPVEAPDKAIPENESLRTMLVKLNVQAGPQERSSDPKDQTRPSSSQAMRKSTMIAHASDSSGIRTGQHKQHMTTQSASLNNIEKTHRPQKSVVSTKGVQSDVGSVASSAVHTTSLPDGLTKNRETQVPRDTGPIRMINEAKPVPKTRNSKDVKDGANKPFQTWKALGSAEKRSRKEGTPEFNQLHFVNGAPADASKTPTERDNDIYGRREPVPEGLQRQAADEPDDKEMLNYALRSYEKGKIPMACYEWSQGLICEFGPARCRFLHREKDETGNPLPVNRGRGIPPKYRNPRVMCLFWFRDLKCNHTAHECIYAHENTGFLPIEGGAGRTHPVDHEIQPGSAEAREICMEARKLGAAGIDFELMDTTDEREHPPPANGTVIARNPINTSEGQARMLPKHAPKPLTCYFWLRGRDGCSRSDENCKFAHENTGWLAVMNGPNIQIDPKEAPRTSSRRQSAIQETPSLPYSDSNVPLHLKTCFFWNEYMCKQPPGNCRSLHQYTGVIADPPSTFQWHRNIQPGWKQRLRDEPQAESHSSDRKSVTSGVDTSRVFVDYPSYPSEYSMKSALVHAIQPDPEVQLQLDYEEMFSCNGGQMGDIVADPNALLLFDPKLHIREHDTVTHWLSSNNVQNVFLCWADIHDQWHKFKDLILAGGSGIVIAHPDFEDYSTLPEFGDVLRGMVRFWAVGDQEYAGFSIWDPKASKDLHIDRFEIFPHGGIIYLTDDVFLKTPQLALRIFEHFIAMVDAGRRVDGHVVPGMYVNDGILLWRLGVRPDLLKWIGDICMNHQSELEQGDPDYESLNTLYVLLTDSRYCEPDSSISNLPADNRRLDYFPIISAHQDLAEDIGLYYKARETSQHDANTDMAHHYSGLVVVERRLYRHYFVVHTEPHQVDWKETITNIDEIMTPERCIEYFEQDPKGNRFENYAWTYPEKRADSASA